MTSSYHQEKAGMAKVGDRVRDMFRIEGDRRRRGTVYQIDPENGRLMVHWESGATTWIEAGFVNILDAEESER